MCSRGLGEQILLSNPRNTLTISQETTVGRAGPRAGPQLF